MIELAITIGLVSVFLVGIVGTVIGIQDAFLENQIISDLNLRSQRAMERIVQLSSQALTTDAQLATLKNGSVAGTFRLLRFQLVQSINGTTGQPVYSTNLVFLYGPDPNDSPNRGVIVGRGPDLGSVYSAGRGVDTLLGTPDDNTDAAISGDQAVELLIPSAYAPQAGDMFSISLTGRLLTVTLRLNAVGTDGNFILANDLVLTERVALRQ